MGALATDKEIVFEAIKQNKKALEYASDKSKNIFEIGISEEKLNENNISRFDNIDFLLQLIKTNYKVFKYFPNKYKTDKDFILKAIKTNPKIVKYLDL